MSNEVIIVELGYLKSRFGFHTDAEMQEINISVRDEDYEGYKGTFRNIMDQAYTALGVTNPANHPVLLLEQDNANSWRRVDQAEVLLGERKAPWMYVMWHSMIVAYGNAPENGTVLVYHLDGDGMVVNPVVAGYPNTIPYGYHHQSGDTRPFADQPLKEEWYPSFDADRPCLVERCALTGSASNLLAATATSAVTDMGDLINTMVLSGHGWDEKIVRGEEDYVEMEAWIHPRRFRMEHVPKIKRPSHPHKQEVFKCAQKLVNDGILVSWDLAFTQAMFVEKGAEEVRRWIF